MIKLQQHSSLIGTNYAIQPAREFGHRCVTWRGKKHCVHGICLTSGYTAPGSMQCLLWIVLPIFPTANRITNSGSLIHSQKRFQWSSRVFTHHAQQFCGRYLC